MTAATALSVTGNDRIKPGGNMTPFDEVTEEILSLYDEAKNWADGEAIKTQDQQAASAASFTPTNPHQITSHPLLRGQEEWNEQGRAALSK